jgi:hypothetical protein
VSDIVLIPQVPESVKRTFDTANNCLCSRTSLMQCPRHLSITHFLRSKQLFRFDGARLCQKTPLWNSALAALSRWAIGYMVSAHCVCL